jgi:hypothetical protein
MLRVVGEGLVGLKKAMRGKAALLRSVVMLVPRHRAAFAPCGGSTPHD